MLRTSVPPLLRLAVRVVLVRVAARHHAVGLKRALSRAWSSGSALDRGACREIWLSPL